MHHQLIKKYLSGNCSPEEAQIAIEILKSAQGEAMLNKIMDDQWPYAEQEVKNHTDILNDINKTLRNNQPNTFFNKTFWRLTAVILLLACTSIWFYLPKPKPQSIKKIEQSMITKSNHKGEKSVIKLSDGSKVYLNSESNITYQKPFSDSARLITLTGEAYFEVAKDSKPFIVLAQGYKTTALGTEFNIVSRGSNYKISLAKGSIKIAPETEASNENYYLGTGEALKINTEDQTIKKETNSNNNDYLWKDGILYFENQSMQEIIPILERWYNVKITYDLAIEHKKFTGRFDNLSLEQVLKSMSFALNFKYSIKEKQVKLIYTK